MSVNLELEDYIQPLRVGIETLYDLSCRLSDSYTKLAAESPDHFIPMAITQLPTGHETGRYLAVYVGLSYLRVAFIDLLGDRQIEGHARVRRTLEKAWPIEEHLRKDHSADLFTWIGDCIAEVVADRLANPSEERIDQITTGISFCLPIKQDSLDEAILMPTGKGFSLSSDLNLRQSLLNGYERHTYSSHGDEANVPAKRRRLFSLPKLKVAVMINDTTATFASLAYSIPSLPNTRVVMGLIVGAGCNTTVPMKLSTLHGCKAKNILEKHPDAEEALVSTEWTLSTAAAPFDELGIRTKWDHQLDRHCKQPGFQPMEYMIGGSYTGELVRIVCYDWFHRALGIQRSFLPVKLVEEYSLSTEFLSLVVAPSQSDEQLSTELSKTLQPPENSDWAWSAAYARAVRTIASVVQDRAASLVASAVVGLLDCTNEVKLTKSNKETHGRNGSAEPQGTENTDSALALASTPDWSRGPEELAVAFSGGVIQHYPHYKEAVQRCVDRLLLRAGPQAGGKSVFLREASDGGLIGTGVLAGTASGEIGEIKVTITSP
ncbi:unnamed protein product [Penicillium salamii]|uniref:Phosphotransferase n=1 Tax=Penicillium salamii TaxID=1612424 RepID=A0A9W4IJJ4_9EURO|nr:unnamed protein product [Penicillium salamii]CAG8136394.1 unnamed protein product [Penicillium salamii]CAG8256058.1 unnamed protein product [Penicillium salamii]CAG8310202.1 unnamed protein product [Penicillium salamii]CAG8317771.1 unnamed protein product [Penicillium salamii]